MFKRFNYTLYNLALFLVIEIKMQKHLILLLGLAFLGCCMGAAIGNANSTTTTTSKSWFFKQKKFNFSKYYPIFKISNFNFLATPAPKTTITTTQGTTTLGSTTTLAPSPIPYTHTKALICFRILMACLVIGLVVLLIKWCLASYGSKRSGCKKYSFKIDAYNGQSLFAEEELNY